MRGQHLKFLLPDPAGGADRTRFQSSLYGDSTQMWNEFSDVDPSTSMSMYQFRLPPVAGNRSRSPDVVQQFPIQLSVETDVEFTYRLVTGSHLAVNTTCSGQLFYVCTQQHFDTNSPGHANDPACGDYTRSYSAVNAISDDLTDDSVMRLTVSWWSISNTLIDCVVNLQFFYQRYELSDGLPLTSYEARPSEGGYLVLVGHPTADLAFSYRIMMNAVWERASLWWGAVFVLLAALFLAMMVRQGSDLSASYAKHFSDENRFFLKEEEISPCRFWCIHFFCCCEQKWIL